MSQSDLIHIGVPITKMDKNSDGTLTVYGKVAGPDLDLDQQVMNPKWLSNELATWFGTGANMREQHQQIAAGVGQELTRDGDDWYLKSLAVDPVTVAKLEHGVLTGHSVGIKNGKVYTKSAKAAKGEIVGGRIVEVSYVDRPCNETCRLTFAKSDSFGDLINLEEPEYVEWDGATQKWIATDIAKANWRGTGGMPPLKEGGKPRYPIKTVADLHDAMQALGRVKAGDRAQVVAHIKSRARSLGATDELTDTYKVAVAELTKSNETPYINSALQALAQLVICEAEELAAGEDERADLSNLLCAVGCLWSFWENEAKNGEVPSPPTDNGDDDDMNIELSTVVDLVKSASADDATDEQKEAKQAFDELVKSASADAIKTAVDEAVAPITEKLETATAELENTKTELETTKAALAEVGERAAPGGPVRARTEADKAVAGIREENLDKAARYDRLAEAITDRELASGYRELAKQAREVASR